MVSVCEFATLITIRTDWRVKSKPTKWNLMRTNGKAIQIPTKYKFKVRKT